MVGCVCVGFSSGSLAWELWNNCVIFALPQPPTIEKLKSVCIQLHQLIAGSLGASKRRQTSRRNAKWGNASDSWDMLTHRLGQSASFVPATLLLDFLKCVNTCQGQFMKRTAFEKLRNDRFGSSTHPPHITK